MNHVLKKTPSWVNYFGISESEAVEILATLSKGQCLIRHLHESGKVSPIVWEKWAKNYFKLPALKVDYKASEHQRLLHERYANLFPNSIAVLEDWDGVLFLGCLAPIEGFQAPQKFQWVLVSLEQLKILRGEKSKIESIQHIDDGMPTGLHIAIPASDDSSEALAPLEPKIFDAPSGVHDIAAIKDSLANDLHDSPMEKTAAFSLDFSAIGLADDSHPDQPPPIEPYRAERTFSPQSILQEETAVTATAIAPLEAEVSQEMEMPAGLSRQESLSAEVPPPIPKISVGPPPIPSLIQEESISSVSPINHGVTIGPPPAPPLGGKQPIDATISSEAIDTIVRDMNAHFERAMLLLFHNSELKVWKASEGWQQDKSRDTAIDLSYPSIFRIVKETKLPYHGYVVGNQINDAFFTTWTKGSVPEHLTIVPVLYEKNLIGMLLGATSQEKASQISLERIQGLGMEAGLSLVSQAAA